MLFVTWSQVPRHAPSSCSPVFLRASWPQYGQCIKKGGGVFFRIKKMLTLIAFKLCIDSCRSLSDIDQDGKLTAEEFILAMHLIDMAMSGLPLPPVLPPDYLPPTFR